jgi:hypothetical protein
VSRSNVLFVVKRRRRNIFIRIGDNAFRAIRKDARTESSRLRCRRIAGDERFNRLESKMDDMIRSQAEFNRALVDRVNEALNDAWRTQEEFNRLLVDRITRIENKVDLIGEGLLKLSQRSESDEMAILEDRMVQLFMKIDTVATTTDNVRRISLNNAMMTMKVAEKTGVTKDEVSTLVGMVHKRVE